MCNKAELSSRFLRGLVAQSSRWLEPEGLIVTHVTGSATIVIQTERGENTHDCNSQ